MEGIKSPLLTVLATYLSAVTAKVYLETRADHELLCLYVVATLTVFFSILLVSEVLSQDRKIKFVDVVMQSEFFRTALILLLLSFVVGCLIQIWRTEGAYNDLFWLYAPIVCVTFLVVACKKG